ncbi:putative zinc-binding metallopeptidase [Butyricimonas sp.]|uniref:putative zinc-binding metallopeptidase n=1 Tax=Butyricimonas sp. TaxID=1969738 RepID=UPI0025C453C6|nr:putative zinc-binding metallopeptidase [Butyricimonas sp.]
MKRIYIYVIASVILWATACSEDDSIGHVDPLEPDYVLPTGTPVDDTIANYYKRYGSYFLYKYTDLEFYYEISYRADYSYEIADPLYVEDMLDLLKEVWMDFYPTEFHQKYMPHRIFIAGTLLDYFEDEIFTFTGTNSLYVGFCSNELENVTPEKKWECKKTLQRLLWSKWGVVINAPEEFTRISDYTTRVEDDSEQARNRGFLSGHFDDGEEYEWSSELHYYSRKEVEQKDFCSFLVHMTTRTSAELTSDLQYPLVRKKYDFLQKWFKEKYNIDLKEIGDTTYE